MVLRQFEKVNTLFTEKKIKVNNSMPYLTLA